MAQIPRSSLDGLTERLNALSEEGKRLVRNALRNAEWGDVAELREILVEAMEAVCSTVSDHSAALTAEFYDGLREESVGEPLGAVPHSGRDPKATEGAVRAFVQSVVETGATDALEKRLMERVDYEVKRASGECVMSNAAADPLEPRFARVPAGAETCRFCIMLASRGFVYRSAESAGEMGHYHSRCDCRIVPGFPGDEVEGYDPDALYRVWRRLENAELIAENLYEGGAASVKKEEMLLNKALKKAWVEGKKSDYYDFVCKKANDGIVSIDGEPRLEGKELQVIRWLADVGWRFEVRDANKYKDESGSTFDFLVEGVSWEVKRIESSSVSKLARRVTEKLDRQGPRFIVDLSASAMDKAAAENKVAWLLEDPLIEEILVIRSGCAKMFRK